MFRSLYAPEVLHGVRLVHLVSSNISLAVKAVIEWLLQELFLSCVLRPYVLQTCVRGTVFICIILLALYLSLSFSLLGIMSKSVKGFYWRRPRVGMLWQVVKIVEMQLISKIFANQR